MKVAWKKDATNAERPVWRATVGRVALHYAGHNLGYRDGKKASIFSMSFEMAKEVVAAAAAELAALKPKASAYEVLERHYVARLVAK